MPVKIGFLEETPGQKSITRAGFAAILFTALFIAGYQVFTTGHYDVVAFTTMASTACGLKLWQKSIESQNTKQNETSSHGN